MTSPDNIAVVSLAYFVCAFSLGVSFPCSFEKVSAVCHMQPNPTLGLPSNINGNVQFVEWKGCYNRSAPEMTINISVSGLPADGTTKLQGFHIHQSGDMSGGCESMGPHYNPFGSMHGAPENPLSLKHVGDLGNVLKDSLGRIETIKVVNDVDLEGTYSVIGRGIVLHEDTDDLGRGGIAGSLSVGNAGRRLACCKIQAV